MYTVPLTAVKPLTLPPVTTMSDGSTDVTAESNVAVKATAVADVVPPDDGNGDSQLSDTPTWYTRVKGADVAALAGVMEPLPLDTHTDTSSDDPNNTVTDTTDGDTTTNDPPSTLPPDT